MKSFLATWSEWGVWFQLKKLEFKLWDSKRFQRKCQRIRCLHLAELEQRNGKNIEDRIAELKFRREQFSAEQPMPNGKPAALIR